MKKRIVSIFVCLLLISSISTVIGSESSQSVGYGEGKIFGINPQVSGDEITCFMLIPQLGKTTIVKTRFGGYSGIIFIFGVYQWFEDGPPALP